MLPQGQTRASPAVFTKGIEKGIYLPVRHGEGKFLTDSPETLARIESRAIWRP